MTIELRDYQKQAIDGVREAFRRGKRRVVLVVPTGGGKTTIACEVIHKAVQGGKSVMFLAHRKELIEQASERLDVWNVDHGIIMAGTDRRNPFLPVQVASIQTLVNREFPPADVIFIDESHRAKASSYLQILQAYPKAAVIGLTATPWRLDGKGLGDIFHEMVQVTTVKELIAMGFLVPPRVFAPTMPDLSGLKVTAGDYNQKQIAELMDKKKLTGDIVDHWKRLALGRKTVVFATSVDHSKHLAEEFRSAGVTAEHLDAKTDKNERKAILNRLKTGETTVVCNQGILTEGWDLPSLSCVVLARPTQSLSLFLQMVGRGARSCEGKDDYIILDHAGCVHTHGMPIDDQAWDLEGRKKKKKAPPVKNCPQCYACMPSPTRECPNCGYKFIVNDVGGGKRGEVDADTGELVEVTSVEVKQKKEQYYAELWAIALKRRYKPKWVGLQFKARFGHWPTKMKKPPEAEAYERVHRAMEKLRSETQ